MAMDISVLSAKMREVTSELGIPRHFNGIRIGTSEFFKDQQPKKTRTSLRSVHRPLLLYGRGARNFDTFHVFSPALHRKSRGPQTTFMDEMHNLLDQPASESIVVQLKFAVKELDRLLNDFRTLSLDIIQASCEEGGYEDKTATQIETIEDGIMADYDKFQVSRCQIAGKVETLSMKYDLLRKLQRQAVISQKYLKFECLK